MSRRMVALEECDTTEEVQNLFQQVFDNQDCIETKLEQVALEVDAMKETKKKTKKKTAGIMAMILLAIMFLLVGTAKTAYVATDINTEIAANHDLLAEYLRDVFANQTSSTFIFTPRTEPGSGVIAKGMVYFDSGTNVLNVSLDGSAFTPIDTAGGVGLDSAYNFGSAGGGREIGADNGAVAITASDGANNVVLEIDQEDTSGAVALTITSAGTGALLSFDSNGAGADILGSDSSWTITKDGKATFTGGGEIDTADFLFNASDAGKDLEWDDSEEALHFLDNCLLTIGGATGVSGDFIFSYDGTDFNLEAKAANDDFRFGETTHFDFSIHGETNTNVVKFDTDDSALLCIFDGFDLRMNDDDVIIFGDSVGSDSFSMYFDETTDNLLIVANTANDQVQFGDGTSSSTDVKMMASTDNDFVLFDASANELFFEDCDLKINEGAQIEFSVVDNSVDWTIDVSTDDTLLFLPALANGTASYNIGDVANTSDVRIFGETASTVVFDATDNLQTNVNYDLLFDDASVIFFGTDKDFSMYSSTADTLEIDPGAAGDQFYIGTSDTDAVDVTWFSDRPGAILFFDEETASVNFGVDATGLDAVFYGDTTLFNMKWDQANDLLTFTGGTAMLEFRGASVDAHATTLAVVEPTATNIVTLPDDTGLLSYIAEAGTVNFSAPGTIPLTDAVVLMTSTGTDAVTLPDGQSAGQILSVVLVAQSGGVATLTPTSVTGSGWATMVFTNIGESATFLYVDSTIGWLCLGTFGATTQPLITQ